MTVGNDKTVVMLVTIVPYHSSSDMDLESVPSFSRTTISRDSTRSYCLNVCNDGEKVGRLHHRTVYLL